MKHLFVAIGQNHLNNFEKLIENGLLPEGPKILMAGSNVVFDPKYWDELLVSENSFDNKSGSAIAQLSAISKKTKAYKSLIDQLGKYRNAPATVYVCYIEDVLSNYLFFSFGKQTQAVVVEDGTLNYYDHSLKNIDKTKFALKQAISFLHGIPFKKYKGHSSGAEYPHVVSQYLTFPEKAFIRDKALQLSVEKKTLPKLHNRLFIIGQEPHAKIIGQENFEILLLDFFEKIKAKAFYAGVEKIYYKPHRNGPRIPKNYLEGVFRDKEVEMIETPLTAEDWFFQKKPCRYVASISSSTVPNIYSKLTEKDKKEIEFHVYPTGRELTAFFQKLGFGFLGQANKN